MKIRSLNRHWHQGWRIEKIATISDEAKQTLDLSGKVVIPEL